MLLASIKAKAALLWSHCFKTAAWSLSAVKTGSSLAVPETSSYSNSGPVVCAFSGVRRKTAASPLAVISTQSVPTDCVTIFLEESPIS